MEHNPKSMATAGSDTGSGETPAKSGGASQSAQKPAQKRAAGRASRVSSRRGGAVKAVEAVKPEPAKVKAAAPKAAAAKAKAQKQINGVRAARIERMMSKAELARRAGLSVLTIDRVEKGLECRMDTKRKVLEALGLRPEDRVRVFGEEE
jgi:DNA-binding XRE family transcriptional regulator